MKLYEKYYKNNFEELITYYPRYYRDVFEMVEILKAFGRVADGLEANIEQTYLNNFILTADAGTIKVWEDLLEITYTRPLTLDQRKRVVIARIAGYGHIGEPEIRGIIANYTERAVAVDFKRGVIFITIEGEIFDEMNLWDTIKRRIPAHLALDMKAHIQRKFRQRIDFYFGGATGAHFRPQPVGEDRVSRRQLYVGYSGRAIAEFETAPVGEDRTGRTALAVGYSGRAEAEFKTAPVGEDRSGRTDLPVGYGGLLRPGVDGIPPDTEKAATGRTEGAGGMYCHTHTKSKLIG